jgi:ABC-type branched-subunit amino acid transport system substrate-binding protein
MRLSFASPAAAINLCDAMSRAFERIARTRVVVFAGTDLHLAVLVPTANSWPEGRASIGAIALAVDAANAQAGQPGPGRAVRGGKVAYSWREVECEPSAALAALTHILDEGPVDAVIGPDCSAACESTAILTAGLDIPQISYSCSSIALSDKKTYPTVRLTIAVTGTVRTRIAVETIAQDACAW